MKLKLLKENVRKKTAEVNFVFEFVATRVSESKLMVEYLHGQAKIISFLCGIKKKKRNPFLQTVFGRFCTFDRGNIHKIQHEKRNVYLINVT